MKKEILGKYTLQTATPEYAKQEAELQKIVFPTLSVEELMTEAQYKRHMEIFPEGQMIVLDGDRVIAATTTLMQNYHKGHHTFLEISDNLWLGTHDPKAEWLYGLDVSVHPFASALMALLCASHAFFLASFTVFFAAVSIASRSSTVAIAVSIIQSRILRIQSNWSSQSRRSFDLYRSCDPEVE